MSSAGSDQPGAILGRCPARRRAAPPLALRRGFIGGLCVGRQFVCEVL
jgi:hypothetical protein